MARFGRVDVLVNNAATNPYHGDLLDLDLPRAEKTVRVNQYGMIAWTRCAWRAWMAEHGGAVVNIASVGGLIVDPHIGYYNATKAAMLHMTRQLAYELGPRARVNAIAPGLIKTELARAVWEVREPILTAKLPLRRLGTVEDVANAALFLASDASSWMTGQTLVLDGGATALPIGVDDEHAATRRRAVLARRAGRPWSPAPPPGSAHASPPSSPRPAPPCSPPPGASTG